MERREVLRMLAAGTALQLAPRNLLVMLREGRVLLGSQSSPRTLTAHQAATVKTMAELILPRTETPGATDVGATEFIDLMLSEWYDEPARARFLNGLADVDSRANTLFNKDFIATSAVQQSEILSALGEKMIADTERLRDQPSVGRASLVDTNFYAMLRHLTLTAYYTSEAGATQELHFEIIPDLHQGCAALPASKEAPERQ